ncbi:MAG: hypothetical protein IKO25_03895 [Clostridia bacterium]|nr:hypothetical protein [Clostridia bacterium]
MSFMTLFSDSRTDYFADKREESFHERPIAAKAVSSFRTENVISMCKKRVQDPWFYDAKQKRTGGEDP